MNKQFLPGIISAGYCKAINLQPDVVGPVDPSKPLKVYGAFTDIPTSGMGSLTVKNEIVKGVPIFTVQTELTICTDELGIQEITSKLKLNDNVFRLVTVDQQKILIGTHEKPFPVVSVYYANENKPTGERIYHLIIIYVNTQSFLLLE